MTQTVNGIAVTNNNTRVNPVALRRGRLAISQEELAEWTGTSKGFVQRVERGTVTQLSYGFMHAICRDAEDIEVLEADYLAWQHHVRRVNMIYIRNILETDRRALEGNPVADSTTWWDGSWTSLRTAICDSKAGFCKLYCIHPGVIDNFEKKDRTKLTPYLLDVMLTGGLERHYIDYLEERMLGSING